MKHHSITVSVVVPLCNESDGVFLFHESLITALESLKDDKSSYEIIYVDDGSTDTTADEVQKIAAHNAHVKLVAFSRNFGKESALAAGIAQAAGQAIIMLDGDGQHPVEVIPKFVQAWRDGAQVVIGVRDNHVREDFSKRAGSRLYYWLYNHLSKQKQVPGSTDFRLISASVQSEFLKLTESDRLTRGLIDWLGFHPVYITFTAKARAHGTPAYNNRKLVGLGIDSILSMSMAPLYLFGYLGVVITLFSFLLGIAVFIEQLLLNDPLHWNFTGTAMLAIMLLFLVGLVLMSQGILSLYISHIQHESKRRPLYVVDTAKSVSINGRDHAG